MLFLSVISPVNVSSPSGLFETDGVLLPNSKCDYKFESLSAQASSIGNTAIMSPSHLPNYSSSSRAPNYSMSESSHYLSLPPTRPPLLNLSLRSNRGRFYSPRYPSTYPRGVRCSYLFTGQSFERIKLVFEHIVLLKNDFRFVTLFKLTGMFSFFRNRFLSACHQRFVMFVTCSSYEPFVIQAVSCHQKIYCTQL